MKRLLLLGGSAQQVVAIETAKQLGYYTILCDFLPDNPGQYAANEFYLVSTTDKEAVLEIAQENKVNGVIAYASDPAAPTGAYVAQQLGLPTNPYQSVEILSNKDKFRAFLKENGFCTPYAKGFNSLEDIIPVQDEFKLPVIIKPIDSSGSKGVNLINSWQELEEKFNDAMSFSRIKRVIIEEYVEKYGYQIAGDGLVIDGELVFRCFANDHFDENCENPFVPISASFPYNMPQDIHQKVHDEIQRLISLLHMNTGTYNFDARIDKNLNVYLMEVAPRSGGNYIPQIIQYATGINLVECAVRSAMGEKIKDIKMTLPVGYWSYYAVHSIKDGILKKVEIRPDVLEKNIIENNIFNKPGDEIKAFLGANGTLGCLIMRFDSMQEMLHMMEHGDEWIKVILE